MDMSHKALHEPCCCWISCSRSAYYVYRCCTESKAVEWCRCSVLAFRVVGAVAYYGLVSIWHRGYTIPSPNENNQVVDQRSARLTSDMPGNAVRVGDQMRIAWAVNISSFSRHTPPRGDPQLNQITDHMRLKAWSTVLITKH